jgi:hypothetical protein
MMRAITAFVVAVLLSGTIVFLRGRETGAAAITAVDAAGSWKGTAEIAVTWTAQRHLRVALVIDRDGSVTGAIGDATLRSGRFASNRTVVGRALRVKTDWIIRGDLEGDVIKAEGIHRDRVSLPLTWTDDGFEGSVQTSGGHIGGKDSMALTAHRLRLAREGAKALQ